LNQATQQNASASEQLAATAEEMSGQAEQLQQVMNFFTLDDLPGGGQPRPARAAAKLQPKRSPPIGEAKFVRF